MKDQNKGVDGDQKYCKKLCLRESINSAAEIFVKEEKKKKASRHDFFGSTWRAQCTEQIEMIKCQNDVSLK